MAIVRTDDKYYKAIADAIRQFSNDPADYMQPRDMATGVKYAFDNGYNEGETAAYNRFWDEIQQEGARTSYESTFSFWSSVEIIPKYPIKTKNLYMTFTNCTKLKRVIAEVIPLNGGLNNIYGAFQNCNSLEEISFDVIMANPQNTNAVNNAFANCTSLKSLKLVLDGNAYVFANTFLGCSALKNLIIEGSITSNGLNLKWSTELSKASITSVINALSSTSSGTTLTLSETAVVNAFGALPNTEWTTLIAQKNNWTISLV